MPTPTRPIRVDLDDWEAFGQAAKEAGTDRSALIRAFMAWYIHRPGATAIKRPPASPPNARPAN